MAQGSNYLFKLTLLQRGLVTFPRRVTRHTVSCLAKPGSDPTDIAYMCSNWPKLYSRPGHSEVAYARAGQNPSAASPQSNQGAIQASCPISIECFSCSPLHQHKYNRDGPVFACRWVQWISSSWLVGILHMQEGRWWCYQSQARAANDPPCRCSTTWHARACACIPGRAAARCTIEQVKLRIVYSGKFTPVTGTSVVRNRVQGCSAPSPMTHAPSAASQVRPQGSASTHSSPGVSLGKCNCAYLKGA